MFFYPSIFPKKFEERFECVLVLSLFIVVRVPR
jgi:hypothetical protein